MTEPEFTSETLARRVAERRELEADLERAQAPLREYLRNVTLTNLETGERTELDGIATITLDPVPGLEWPEDWVARAVAVAAVRGLVTQSENGALDRKTWASFRRLRANCAPFS